MVFDPDVVRSLLQRQKIATLGELKESLGTSATMTVFRKLKALGYRTIPKLELHGWPPQKCNVIFAQRLDFYTGK